jgi:hypothetical protein
MFRASVAAAFPEIASSSDLDPLYSLELQAAMLEAVEQWAAGQLIIHRT